MSSNDLAVSVRGLSKSYTIAHEGTKTDSAAELVMDKLKNPFKRQTSETFWALKDVEFDIKKGDVVGIIGRNGAGKSTLLKILSQITEPTTGEIRLYGRVGSLLEVGTGFHPELTGRENVFLNGAILGMRKSEIQRQFDAIVDFSGVEQFLDTPVKRYSSGMYVRLAFAVAAHLNPEILIVDEVLAVGDATFQKKCMGKIKDVATSGRSVILVSHNTAAIRNLCDSGILLKNGSLVYQGIAEKCITAYIEEGQEAYRSVWKRGSGAVNSQLVFKLISNNLVGNQPNHELVVKMELESLSSHPPALIAIDILDPHRSAIMQAQPLLKGFIVDSKKNHNVTLSVNLPPLVPGRYVVTAWVGSHNTETFDEVSECVSFEVTQSPASERTVPYTPIDHGYIIPPSTVEY